MTLNSRLSHVPFEIYHLKETCLYVSSNSLSSNVDVIGGKIEQQLIKTSHVAIAVPDKSPLEIEARYQFCGLNKM